MLEAINKLVADKNADLIVMGSKGATDSIDVLLGGNSIKVMEKVRSCPVLMIPTKAKFKTPKEIVFPTGYDLEFNKKEIAHLTQLAKDSKATIRVLYVGDPNDLDDDQKKIKTTLKTYLGDTRHSFHSLEDVDVHTALRCFTQSTKSDMIAFLNKKHGFFETIFRRPMVKELGYHSELPVLALHC